MNTNEKGNLGFAMVIADVMKKGYFVFMPIADTTNVDLIIANDKMNLKRVQVKYRKKTEKGVIEIPTTTVINGKKVPTDLSKIDIWAVYCPDTNKMYYIPTQDLIGKATLSLRIDKPKKLNNCVIYAEKYIELEF